MKAIALSSARLAILGVLVSSVAAPAAVLVDFNTAGDLASKFRFTYNPVETNTVQTGGIVSTSATALSSGATLSETLLYDTTPADATVKDTFSGPVTISFDLRGAQTSSFGIYIVNPSEAAGVAAHRLALFNLDNAGTSDQLRIFSTSSITNAAVGTAAYNSGPVSVASTGAQFVSASLTYAESAINAGHAVMNFTVNGVSTGSIDLGANTYNSTFEIGLRVYDSSLTAGSADIDNFSVVPEPSIMGLAAAGLVVMGAMRRRGNLRISRE